MGDFDPRPRGLGSDLSKDEYLASLQENNRSNVEVLSERFSDHLRQVGKRGVLIAVGGTVKPATRGTPRKDIDLYAVINNADNFDDWLNDIKQIGQNAGLEIDNIQRPIPSKEYDEAFNDHDGSVIFKPNSGVPIEIVNAEVWRNSDEALAGMISKGLPFSILALIKD